jgi:hypothetical protein
LPADDHHRIEAHDGNDGFVGFQPQGSDDVVLDGVEQVALQRYDIGNSALVVGSGLA